MDNKTIYKGKANEFMKKPIWRSRTVWTAIITCIAKVVADYLDKPKLSEKIKTYPDTKEEDIRKLKEMGKGVTSLKHKIDSRNLLKNRVQDNDFRVFGYKEILFHIERGQEEPKPYAIDQPFEMTSFQSLSLHYPKAFPPGDRKSCKDRS